MGTLRVGVPPFRSNRDISIPEDILEEVLRVHGFDNIPPVMPTVPVTPLIVEKPLKMKHKMRRVLATAHRFLETHNYIWFNDNWLKALNYEPGETLVLKNPTSPETSRLRTTLIPNLLALVPKNRPFRESFRLFEMGRTFFSVQKDKECLEKETLGGVAYQRTGSWEDFYLSVKSAVEDVLAACGVRDISFKEPPNPLSPLGGAGVRGEGENNGTAGSPRPHPNPLPEGEGTSSALPEGEGIGSALPEGEGTDSVLPEGERGTFNVWQSPGNFVTIYSGNKPLGTLGILDTALTAKVCREGGQIVWFEMDLDEVAGTLYPEVQFEEPPRYPLSWQDFSLLWSVENGFDTLESLLDRFTNPLVIRREFLVSYRGKGVDKGMACYSFRFWIGSPDHTLSGEEIESFHQQFLAYIRENNVSLRT